MGWSIAAMEQPAWQGALYPQDRISAPCNLTSPFSPPEKKCVFDMVSVPGNHPFMAFPFFLFLAYLCNLPFHYGSF